MKVMAFDPFLSAERAMQIGVEKVELDALLRRTDFITLHTPLTDKTRNILSAEALAKCRRGVRIVNCARGGLIDEKALAEALKSGQVAGVALDVFEVEPAKENVLFGIDDVICTPHLGASTTEAQEKVALQVAEQMSDYLLSGAISNAVNFPSISAEEAGRILPFVKLAEQLGLFAGQLTETSIASVRIEYSGEVASLNVKPMTAAALAGVLRPFLVDVNMVSAGVVAKERGIVVEEVSRDSGGMFESTVRLCVRTPELERSIAGDLLRAGRPRIIEVRDIPMDFEISPHMLFVRNPTSRASSAGSARCSARPMSTSRHSISGGSGPAGMPSAWSPSTRPCRTTCSRRSRLCRTWCACVGSRSSGGESPPDG